MFRFVAVLALALVAVVAASPANNNEYTFSINFNKLNELQNLNKIFKPLSGYKVQQVAIQDDVKAVVTVNENLKDSLKNYLDVNKIQSSVKLGNLFHRYAREAPEF